MPGCEGCDTSNKTPWPAEGYLSAFRIKPTKETARLNYNTRQRTKLQTSAQRVYRSRRTHHKSRAGCRNCKSRRVKCDETRPHCRACDVYGVTCDYALPQCQDGNQPLIVASLSSRPLHRNGSLSFDAMTTNINSLLQVDIVDERNYHPFHPSESLGSLGLGTFAHFSRMVRADEPLFAHLKQVFRERILHLALGEPCLLHAILAAASTHQACVLPSDPRKGMVAASFRHKATRMYRKLLQSPIGPNNMDVLFSTCMLIGIFSFAIEKINPLDSWVLSDDPSAMNWLSVQGGLRCLLDFFHPWISDSVWSDAFKTSSAYEFYDDHRTGREDLDPALATLCDIDDTTTEEANAFHWPLRMLSPLLRIPQDQLEESRIANFMGRLPPDYLHLLASKEPRALLLLAYWLALMCSSVHEWWVYARVRSECLAICMYLERCGDERIMDFNLLEFPAAACGYRYRDFL